MKKTLLNYTGLIISMLYSVILLFCHTDNGKDSVFIFLCFSVFLISIPFQIILSVAYGVFAFRKENYYTPIVPFIILISLYKYLNYYISDLSGMPLSILFLIIGIVLAFVLLFILIRLKISFWVHKNTENILKLTAKKMYHQILFFL